MLPCSSAVPERHPIFLRTGCLIIISVSWRYRFTSLALFSACYGPAWERDLISRPSEVICARPPNPPPSAPCKSLPRSLSRFLNLASHVERMIGNPSALPADLVRAIICALLQKALHKSLFMNHSWTRRDDIGGPRQVPCVRVLRLLGEGEK